MTCLAAIGTLANYLVNYAIVHGKGGPASALSDCHTLWSLMLEIVFLGREPTLLMLMSFVCALTGGALISMARRRNSVNK